MGIIIEMKNPVKDLDAKIKEYRRNERIRIILSVLTIFAAVISTYLLLEMQTYTKMDIVKSYGEAVSNNGSYEGFADGVLKYSRDGIAYLSKTGEEQWNQSYQIKTPVIVKSEKAVAVSELEGNDIYIFDEDGMKGEIHTTYPIEKMAVSDNGIVAVLLKVEDAPKIVCFDVDGHVLVEHRASMSGTGYPIGLALSPDGTRLAVSYMTIEGTEQATRVAFYDFRGDADDKKEYLLGEEVIKNAVIPTLRFVSDKQAVAVGNTGYFVYKINDTKLNSKMIKLDKEITSVFFEEDKVGFVLRKAGEEGQEVRVCDLAGKTLISKGIDGEYKDMNLSKGNVLLYDGKKVCIISSWGICEFNGEIEQNVMEIISLSGINKFLVMNSNGMDEVRLIK